jgi:hypothetical protein
LCLILLCLLLVLIVCNILKGFLVKKIINLFLLLFVIFIAGCSRSGSNGADADGSGTPTQIGYLPNGSAVYISQNNLPINSGNPAHVSIYLEGGSSNESYNVTFATNLQLQTRLNVSESYGINIITTPSPCIIGTAGSGAPDQCQVTIASSANTYPGTYLITPTAVSTAAGGVATTLNPLTILVSGSIKPNTKAITFFSLNGTSGVITGQNIAVTMPYGTNVTDLVATYITTGQSVKVNNVIQTNGVTKNDFTNPVVYTVIAEDGSTQNYTVTVTVAASSANAITSFSLNGTAGVISGQNISVAMPYGTNVMALIATFTTTGQSVTVGATSQVSGVTPNDFTNSVTYTVTAADGSTQDYTVTVTVALNSDNHMIEFSIGGTIGVIDQNNNTIAVAMPYGTSDVSSLTASYITDGESVTVASVEQVNGVTPNNFTNPVTYVVHAANGDTRNYVVTVTIKPVISQATAISFAGNYAFLTSNVSSDITMCSVTNESQLTACRNISESNLSLPQGASSISAFESSGGITLFITANEIPPTPPSIFQCLIPTGGASTCSKINPAPGLQSNRLLSTAALNPESSAKITSFAIGGVSGLINNNNIYVTLPYGANLNGLAATFTNTGKSVKVNNLVQVSGVTTNNFTNNVPLQYIVTAKNNTTSTYNVYVRWSIFSGVTINPYAPSAINAPLVYSTLESKVINISVEMVSGLYSGANYDLINSFPASMNANGLSSIALATIVNAQGGFESYQYVMTNIAESVVYACKVNQSASGLVSCRQSDVVSQPSSLVVTGSVPTTSIMYVSSYSQNILVPCAVYDNAFACDTSEGSVINPPGIFNLPRSLSVNSDRTWLFALNEGDNSYAACQINGITVDPATCRKTYFSSL